MPQPPPVHVLILFFLATCSIALHALHYVGFKDQMRCAKKIVDMIVYIRLTLDWSRRDCCVCLPFDWYVHLLLFKNKESNGCAIPMPFLCHSYAIPICIWPLESRIPYGVRVLLIDLVLYTRTKVVLFLVLTRRSCFSLSSGSCLILEACSCPVAWVALSLFCLWDHCL